MGELLPMPKAGDVFVDVRGVDRAMRISRYDDQGVVVVSIWAERVCRASFRLSTEDAPRMIAALGGCGAEHPAAEDPAAEDPAAERPVAEQPVAVQEPTQFLELDDHPTVAIPEAS
jgi:hypothetical protein